MAQKKAEKQQKAQQAVEEKEALTEKVTTLGGVWSNEAQVDEGLEKVKAGGRGGAKGKMTDALKTQMSFRRKVWGQKLADPKLWNVSENGRAFTVDELAGRLKRIIGEHQRQKQQQQQQQQQQLRTSYYHVHLHRP